MLVGWQTTKVVDALDELCRRQLVKEQQSELYVFRHNRIRDVAYRQQSLTRRRLVHRRIRQVVTQLYGESVDNEAGELAVYQEQVRERHASHPRLPSGGCLS